MLLGTAIFVFRGQDFFGGDAFTYDFLGFAQTQSWAGDRYYWGVVNAHIGHSGGTGWGMIYLVAAIYSIVGRNLLAVQFVNAVVGAATAAIIYLCAMEVVNNGRVARISALAVAFFPSLVLWSSQGLKDGPIVFFLALSIRPPEMSRSLTSSHGRADPLIFAYSVALYVFYMLAVAVAGTFVIGTGTLTGVTFIRQFAAIVTMGLALTYVGITRYTRQLEHYTNLERIQRSRQDSATRGQSGFATQSDVSTTDGALSTIPIGLLYLLFAPFPCKSHLCDKALRSRKC